MKPIDAYHRWVEWSDEDQVYVGKCPDLITGIHGDDPVQVVGSVTPGTAWVESPRFSHLVVTRAGGFGGEGALTELLWGTLPS